MEFTEQAVYEAFGIEQPQAQAEELNAETEQTEGAQEQEVAEPAVEENDPTEAQETETNETETKGEEADKQKLTPQQRHENAERRRQEERQRIIDDAKQQARAEADKELEGFFESLNLTNPYDGDKPIKTREEFAAYQKAFKNDQLQRELANGEITPQTLEHAVKQLPQFQQMEKLLQQTEESARQIQQKQFDEKVSSELAEIRKWNPKIQTLGDILNLPTGEAFSRYVRENGLSYYDAYRLANADEIRRIEDVAAGQKAAVAAQSKAHLQGTKARGRGDIAVPADVQQYYRAFFPNATVQEISNMYNAQMRGKGT